MESHPAARQIRATRRFLRRVRRSSHPCGRLAIVLALLTNPSRRIGALEGILGFVTSLFLFIAISAVLANECSLCEPGRLSPWVDLAASLLLVGGGVFARIHRPRNGIWLLAVAAGWGRQLELGLAHLGAAEVEVIWHSLRNLLLVAVPWHIAVAFPTGRALRGWRWLVVGWYGWAAVASTIRGFFVDWDRVISEGTATHLNPALDVWEGWGTALVLLPRVSDALIAASVVALFLRWRSGNRSVRRAFAPVFVILPLLLTTIIAGFLDGSVGIPILDEIPILAQQLSAFALPVALVLGIVGPRVFEGRIATLIDDLETAATLARVEVATQAALEDPSVRLLARLPVGWRDADGLVHGEPTGEMHTEIVLDGELLGVISHDRTSDFLLMASVASTVALALRRIQLKATVEAQLEEVSRSRQRIVEAGDEARRTVERDLHDGAQQSLVVLAMDLDRQKERFEDPEVHQVLDAAASRARKALTEIRRLSQGMYPSALSSDGLHLAIEGLAHASPIPTTIDVVEGRFGRHAETTAYFVVAESLANAVKHSQAREITVRITATIDALHTEVRDDGVGGAVAHRGGGIEGLGDRVSAVGGEFEVWSQESAGTTVRATIPLGPEDQRSG